MRTIIPQSLASRQVVARLGLLTGDRLAGNRLAGNWLAGDRRTRELLTLNGSLQQRLAHAAEQIARLERTLHQARRDAMTDALTGLSNRRAFDEAVGQLAAASCGGSPGEPAGGLALLLLDVDHFKLVNDRHGHAVGDKVLRAIAAALGRTVRCTDLVARYGGEEFAVLLPATGAAGALALAETLRAQIAAQRIDAGSGAPVGVTISIGAACHEPGEPPADFVARADAGLYIAKRSGRNRVAFGPADPVPAEVPRGLAPCASHAGGG